MPTSGFPQNALRDRPFSGHWRASELADRLGLPAAHTVALATAREAVIAEAIIASMRGQKVSYSRRSVWYSPMRRYLHESCTFATVPVTVDDLCRLGYIKSDLVKPGSNRRLQSTFEASPALMDAWSGQGATLAPRPQELIWLRDERKKLQPYDDTRETTHLRRLMRDINEGVAPIRIGVPEARRQGPFLVVGDAHLLPRPDNGLVRIFNNGTFEQGGRMFGWYQGIPKAARRTMTINGELIAEADFAAMHISILYIEAGLRLDGDAYDVGPDYTAGDAELTRNHVKRAVNTMLNARTRHQAAWALKTELQISLSQANLLIHAVGRRHARISCHFFTGVGMKMMRTESDVMTEVVCNLLAAGIPCLPIHDAVLMQAKHYQAVEAEMYAAFERQTGVANVVVRRKG